MAESFDAVVTDLSMVGMGGLELCERISANRPDVPVIIVTGFGSLETATQAIRAGAYDFVTKPFVMEDLLLTLARAGKHRALREEVRLLRHAVQQAQRFGDLIGASAPMKKIYGLLERVTDSESSVLISGESGTGKEVVARALHRLGRRASGPFVAINCAAIPESLLESELFGHARGAFTDAKSAHPGLFVQADGGTVLLDEIGDMPLGLQPKLLRALQDRAVRPVGGTAEVAFDARVVTATHCDLEELVDQHRFREDLYYRINVIRVALPPLRARGTDVLLLAQHYVEHFAARAGKRVEGVSAEAAEKLLAYTWPGNVRELQNVIERAVALTRYENIAVEDLPEPLRAYRRSRLVFDADDPSAIVPLGEVERRYILRVVESVHGNRAVAAQLLGLDRKTLYRKLKAYATARPARPD
jgi:two-component system response regulator HydG